jgi:hypothetical protein
MPTMQRPPRWSRTLLGLIGVLLALGSISRARADDVQVYPTSAVLDRGDDGRAHVSVTVNRAALLADGADQLITDVTFDGLSIAPDGEDDQLGGLNLLNFSFDPCELPGHATALPGDEIGLSYDVRTYKHGANDAQEIGTTVLTLGPDTLAPIVVWDYDGISQGPHQTVRPGQAVPLRISGHEPVVAGSWDTSVHRVRAMADGATIFDQVVFAAPGTCAKPEYFTDLLPVTYTVPADAKPGQVIMLQGTADDFANNLGTTSMQLVVAGDEWRGTWHATAIGNVYNDQVDIDFTFSEAADGTLTGTRHGVISAQPQLFTGCTHTRVYSPTSFDVVLTGQRSGDTFVFDLRSPTPTTAAFTASGCGSSGSATQGPAVSVPAFASAAKAARGVRVPALDGGTNSYHAAAVSTADIEVTASVEIHRAR